jgi:hypothetical protein
MLARELIVGWRKGINTLLGDRSEPETSLKPKVSQKSPKETMFFGSTESVCQKQHRRQWFYQQIEHRILYSRIMSMFLISKYQHKRQCIYYRGIVYLCVDL